MAKLSTAAWIAHNLGIGASFGGLLFGKLALNPNLDVISSEAERGKMLNAAWNRYNIVNALSVGTAAATWWAGRAAISGEALDDEGRNLVLAKDALFIASAVTGLISILSGLSLARQAPEGATPIETGTTPSSDTPEKAASLLRRVNILGNLNLILIASIGAITTILSQKAGKSTRWSVISRFLP